METIAQTLASIAATLVAAFVPIAVRVILRRLKLDEDAALRQNLETALTSATGAAYGAMIAGRTAEEAQRLGADYVTDRMHDTMKKLGVSRDQVPSMVAARFGALLAADPTVQGPQPQ
jgi:hypothetical protein